MQLVISLLLVLSAIMALSYYDSREYFGGSSSKPSGPNGSYGTLNVPGAQLGNGQPPYDPMSDPMSMTLYNNPSDNDKAYYQPNLQSKVLPTVDAIGNDQPLFDPILGNPRRRNGPQSFEGARPIRNDITPQVSVSDTGYTAMDLQNKSALLRNIQSIVHNELAANRNQPENNPIAMGDGDGDDNSSSVQQGREHRCHKKDMSKYIKKDSIPCWGCTLDY